MHRTYHLALALGLCLATGCLVEEAERPTGLATAGGADEAPPEEGADDALDPQLEPVMGEDAHEAPGDGGDGERGAGAGRGGSIDEAPPIEEAPDDGEGGAGGGGGEAVDEERPIDEEPPGEEPPVEEPPVEEPPVDEGPIDGAPRCIDLVEASVECVFAACEEADLALTVEYGHRIEFYCERSAGGPEVLSAALDQGCLTMLEHLAPVWGALHQMCAELGAPGERERAEDDPPEEDAPAPDAPPAGGGFVDCGNWCSMWARTIDYTCRLEGEPCGERVNEHFRNCPRACADSPVTVSRCHLDCDHHLATYGRLCEEQPDVCPQDPDLRAIVCHERMCAPVD